MQMVSMDFIGPFVTSTLGNRYILTIICHCSGWAEACPIPNKSNDSVWRMFANHFVPSRGTPEVILTDNAQEFTAKVFTNALEKLGIEHRRCTPTHPNSNGKIERFNRTFKETLSILIQNQPDQWENHVGDTLAAHRISVSSVTGYSPFYLLHGRQPRAPLLSRLLQASTQIAPFGNRPDDLAQALSVAHRNTVDNNRVHNQERLAKRADAKQIHVGDTVVLIASEPLTFTSKWDPQWQITRVSGLTGHIRNQVSGENKIIHRDHVKIFDPSIV